MTVEVDGMKGDGGGGDGDSSGDGMGGLGGDCEGRGDLLCLLSSRKVLEITQYHES